MVLGLLLEFLRLPGILKVLKGVDLKLLIMHLNGAPRV